MIDAANDATRKSRQDQAVTALVSAIESFIKLGGIDDPQEFVGAVARELSERFGIRVALADADGGRPATAGAAHRTGASDGSGAVFAESPPRASRPAEAQNVPKAPTGDSSNGNEPRTDPMRLPVPERPAEPRRAATASVRPRPAKVRPAAKRRLREAVETTGQPREAPLPTAEAPKVQMPEALPPPEPIPLPIEAEIAPEPDSPPVEIDLPPTEGEVPAAEAEPAATVPEALLRYEVESLDDRPPARSNVTFLSNVYARDSSVAAHADKPFRLQIRGKHQIIETFRAAGIVTTGPAGLRLSDGVKAAEVFSPRQRQELKQYKCVHCGRWEYGPVRQPDGKIKWGFLSALGRACRHERHAVPTTPP